MYTALAFFYGYNYTPQDQCEETYLKPICGHIHVHDNEIKRSSFANKIQCFISLCDRFNFHFKIPHLSNQDQL